MALTKRQRVVLYSLLGFAGICAIAAGILTGFALASVQNVRQLEAYGTNRAASLPSQILDRDGELITEFFSDENRELVSIDELPRHLIYALVTREDGTFFEHHGFSFQGTARAAWNLLTNRYVSGGSTLTQQLAGHLYADRSEFSVTRKLRELWWALQIERNWTKYEILERYLNTMFFGHGNYGVEAASQFYFGHTARELTVAESVMLVIQLANPSLYSPIRNPNRAKEMQRTILNQMVERGYATQEEVDDSFTEYWNSYDFTRASTSTAFFEREDKAPYFSEYVRYQLENELLLGSLDVNRDGFVVHTTLDLDHQFAADRYMQEGITEANSIYQENTSSRADYGNELVPIIDLLSLGFNIESIHVGDAKQKQNARKVFQREINPILDVVTLMFGTEEETPLRQISRIAHLRRERESQRTTVEGALITIENETGHILAMVGGSRFESRNQFNRAVDAKVEPGSSFKPLYYAAGIEQGVITPATMLYDSPVVFWNDDGSPYTPENYRGEWEGPVLVRRALAHSMNVPSLKVLDRVGFSDALETATRLLGIPEREMESRNLVRKYPVGLGIVEAAPIEMARAFATFPNRGQEVEPIAIRYIEDRNGRIVLEPEAELRKEQRERSEERRILSEEAAYVMTDLLQSTVESGTLRYAETAAGGFDQPMAGKTGTTQNWADAWTVGFTPYYTTAIWMGFDRGGGNSLGVNQTGAVTAGPVWGKYMKEIHEGLPKREFIQPDGIVEVPVTARSGLLPPATYRGEVIDEIFIAGTEPTRFDQLQQFEDEQRPELVNRLKNHLNNASFSLGAFPLATPIEETRSSDPETEERFRLDLDLSLSRDDLSPGRPGGSATIPDQEEGNPLLD
ncbi:MAG: penicillin-binding protein 1A [Spirochaetaceae bacterium]